MSERETFMARWSRRKRASAQESEAAEPSAPADATAEAAQEGEDALASAVGPGPDAAESPLPQLPPIESIVAESDVRAFLAPGVPPELTRAALRRAWSADPKIRDFIGLSENSWDFNDPSAIPGFGPLELTDELRREIARMIGRSLGENAPDTPSPSAPDLRQPQPQPLPEQATSAMPPPQANSALPPAQQDAPVQLNECDAPVASAPDGDRREPISKRRHGRALPQ